MRKVFWFVACLLVIGSLVAGCSSSTSTDTTTTTTAASTTTTATATTTSTSTTIAPGTLVAISGTLNSGTVASAARISAAGLRTQATAYAAIADDTMVAVSKDTGMIYFPSGETDATGNFTIPDLPAGESFFLAVLDSDKKLSAPVAFGETGGGAAMAVSPGASDLALGSIVYDDTKDVAAPVTPPTSVLDPASTVEAKAGETLVPKGAGTFGKGADAEFSGTYDSALIDGDKDGLPNLLDADNNGDGIIDEFDGLCTLETLAGAPTKIAFAGVFTNLKVNYMNTLDPPFNQELVYWITIGLSPKPGNTISSAYVSSGPSWLPNARVIRASYVQVTDPTDYALYQNQNWSTTSPDPYKLWTTSDGSVTVFIGNVIPSTEVKAGDTLTFHVNFSDGTSEEVCKMINFAFADIPKLCQYRWGHSGSWADKDPDYSGGNIMQAYPITTSEVSLRWFRPHDETGTEIIGARYIWEYWTHDPTQVEVIAAGVDTGTTLSLEATMDITQCATREDGNANIGIGITNNIGDNAVQNLQIAKQKTWP